MTPPKPRAPGPDDAGSVDFSLVLQDPLHDAQRATRLMPLGGYGLGRRIGLAILVTWVPLALWALWYRRAFPGVVGEPLLQHFGIHVRFLIAVPLLIAAEPFAEVLARRLVSYFLVSGLVSERERPAFGVVIQRARRSLASRLALGAILAVAIASAAWGSHDTHLHELTWVGSDQSAPTGWEFPAWWFLWVSRPIYQVLMLSWLWRLAVTAIMMWNISRLDLQLVPSHPDMCAGLGFLDRFPMAFAPVVVAASAVISARWGHDVLYHGVPISSLRLPMILSVALMLVVFLAPLLAFAPRLLALKRRSVFSYGALIGQHGRLVDRRWIRREQIEDDGLLSAPELGPVADTLTLYNAVSAIRPAPISMRSVLAVGGAAVLPMLPVVAIEIPIKDQLLGVLKALM